MAQDNAQRAWDLLNFLRNNVERVAELKQRITETDDVAKKAEYTKYVMANLKNVKAAKEELASIPKGSNLGRVFESFGKKLLAEGGADGAKAVLSKIGKFLPGASAVAGIVTAIQSGDVAAVVPGLESSEAGPAKGTEAYSLEMGEPQSEGQRRAEALQIAQNIKSIRAQQAAQKAGEVYKDQQAAISPVRENSLTPEERAEAEQVREWMRYSHTVGKDEGGDFKPNQDVERQNIVDEGMPRATPEGIRKAKEDIRKNSGLMKDGGFVKGKKDEFAGDRIDAKLNRGEMVLNVDQQQRLFEILKGEKKLADLPDKNIVDSKGAVHAEEGALLPDFGDLPPVQDIPMAPVDQAPVAPMNAAPAVGLPESMQYTGPDAGIGGTLPVQPEISVAPAMLPPAAPAPSIVDPSAVEIEEAAKPIREGRAVSEALRRELLAKDSKDAEDTKLVLARLDGEDKKINEIDPNRFWNNLSTPQKILAGIAVVVGGLIGLKTGRNWGLDFITGQIDNDIQAQKVSQEEALARKNYALNWVKTKLDRMQTLTDDKNKRLNILNAINEIDSRNAMVQQQRLKLAALKLGQVPDTSMLTEDERKMLVPGYGIAKDIKSAEKANDAIAIGEQLLKETVKIEELWEQYGTREVLSRGAVSSEESARLSMQLQLKELFNLGVLNGPDLTLLNKYVGEDFFAVTTSDASKRAKLNAVKEFTRNKIDASLKRASLPESQETRINSYRLEALKKANPKTPEVQLITALKRKGLWKE